MPFGGSRGACFSLQIAYLLGLAALATLYFTHHITPPRTLDSIPIAVPWFGAVGAVLLSLSGIFDHYADWLPSYRFWHWARPAVGAAVAVIGVLMVQAGILAINQNPVPAQAAGHPGEPRNLLYYLLAFLVGYREETFRTLVKRLTDVILGPGDAAGAPATVVSMSPTKGPVSGGQTVTFAGTKLSTIRSVLFGEAEVSKFDVLADAQIVVKTPPASSPGLVKVLVLRDDGTAILQSYTYEDPPMGEGGSPAPAVPEPPQPEPA